MSVDITFQPIGLTGLVAEGTYVIDAARRMGVPFPEACQGRGRCTACLVRVVAGNSLLSAPTDHELISLGADFSERDQRLACETTIERSGELIVEVIVLEQPKEKKDVRKTFTELPLDKKFTTLVQLEMLTMREATDAALEKALSVSGRVVNLVKTWAGPRQKSSPSGSSSESSSEKKR